MCAFELLLLGHGSKCGFNTAKISSSSWRSQRPSSYSYWERSRRCSTSAGCPPWLRPSLKYRLSELCKWASVLMPCFDSLSWSNVKMILLKTRHFPRNYSTWYWAFHYHKIISEFHVIRWKLSCKNLKMTTWKTWNFDVITWSWVVFFLEWKQHFSELLQLLTVAEKVQQLLQLWCFTPSGSPHWTTNTTYSYVDCTV